MANHPMRRFRSPAHDNRAASRGVDRAWAFANLAFTYRR
jgi:hypothetical protein